jgi:CubicO group peptidase (beta-lactamase class C family)
VGTVVLVLLLLIVVGLVAVYRWQRPLLVTGTGYAAHNDCAVRHVARRSDPENDLPPNPLVPHLRMSEHSDGEGGRVDASLRGLLAEQTAWHAGGFGCTIAEDRPDLPRPTEVTQGHRWTDAPLAEPAAAGPGVAQAISRAFGDDLAEHLRDELGTRAVVVLHRGRLVAERYADGFDERTPQLGWSMTKSVTNLMVGALVARGVVSLDDHGLREEWIDERADITVEHLLRMTSGLGWDETYELGTPITRMLYIEPDMAGYVAGQPAEHTPGAYQEYSSGSTNLLCDVVADKAGVRGAQRADLPRQLIFEPLGLTSAVMEPDASGNPVCSSYMWATPRDWAVVGQLALQQGRWQGEQLLPAGWMRRSTVHERVAQSEEEGYAAGWWVNREEDGTIVDGALPEDTIRASGHDGQMVAVVPSADLVVVRLGFTPELEDTRTSTLVSDLVNALGRADEGQGS